ncbi:MAG: hypothetical protein CVU00_01750 [Bacteroidetes bacterium HGW-Bacteroidetes-17]|nr:MAG: hypothetical protein CVU00_01750 [Bacteroidetes bacterium HGW-Bacteroidetes-17]
MKKLIIIFNITIIWLSSIYAQESQFKKERFLIPNSLLEVSVEGSSYEVIKDGIPQRFRQKNFIRFRDLIFDPLLSSQEDFIPDFLEQQNSESLYKSGINEENAYIIQFKTQAFEGYQSEIIKMGGKIYTPLHDHSLIILLNNSGLEKVKKLPFVRWVGSYHPSFKLEPLIKEELLLKKSGQIRYSILLLHKSFQDKIAAYIQEVGGVINLRTVSNRLEASLSGDQLLKLANRKEVLYIDKWTPSSNDMDVVRGTQGANFLENVANYTGQGVNGEVLDDGVFSQHIDFIANPPMIHGFNDNSNEHGTPVFGIVFGASSADGKSRGILPDAKNPIFSSRLHVSDRYQHTAELVNPNGLYRAVFQTNSWGSELTKEYTTISAEIDQMAFDLDLLILQSQSNEGTQLSRPQAWSKNVVSVGGIRHFNTSTRSDDAWGGETGASIGPASDGRIKPDLSNFYDYTHTTKINDSYGEFSGTSGSTPITAGHFGLLFQMWAEGVFSGDTTLHRNVFDSRPHMTTAKAMMINLAYQYDFSGSDHDKTRMHQGWGVADVKNIYENARDHDWKLGIIIDEEDVIIPLEEKSYEVNVDGVKPLKITLVYADPPGSPAATKQLINDLNLKLISPSGKIFWGNNGLDKGNWSVSEGEPNHLDNVENIFIKNPETGIWKISVIAEEVVKDAHLETEQIDADYALIVSGDRTNKSIQYFKLNTNFSQGDSIIIDPPGGIYRKGESVVLIPFPRQGYKFMNWEDDAQGSANPLTLIMDKNKTIGAKFAPLDQVIGNTTKFSILTSASNRRAMPFLVPHDGLISSISMFHNGGSQNMILGVYNGTTLTPDSLIGVTEVTQVSPNDDWQTIDLVNPAKVTEGQQIWLAWVYENNPGIYYTNDYPGRVESGFPWPYGMPEMWGDTAKMANSIYSIYANYVTNDSLLARIRGPISAQINEPVQFNSERSFYLEEIISYEWDFGDGNTSVEANPIHIYTFASTYNVSLKITNGIGHKNTTNKSIAIIGLNQSPVAEANGPYSGMVDSIISFSKFGSYDPDGLLTGFFWDFGDGSNSLLSNPTHVYTETGDYIVTFRAVDQYGNVGMDTAIVAINDFTLSDDHLISTHNEFLIYPNPVNSSNIRVVIPKDFLHENHKIRLINLEGNLVKEFIGNENEFKISLEGIPNGIYIITIQGKGKLLGSKIVLLR